MVLTDAGLAFGDADTASSWINPNRNAWDDFDWMRYAYQTANNEDDAVELLTTDAVDNLHATGVSENLFIVGPKRSIKIEADAIHHTTTDISDILVMSNYAVDLWHTQLLKSLPIASSFDTKKETTARSGTIIRLQSLCGVKIIDIDQVSITVKAVPSFVFRAYGQDNKVTIPLGQRATVGPYSVKLLEISQLTVKISVCTKVHAWEQELLTHLQQKTGTITVQEMIDVSRLHSIDLDGLRPLCEDIYPYEASVIYKILEEHSNLLSSGWFGANHACSSIYVPFHICDNDIYDPYQTGEAAGLSLELLHYYGHGTLTSLCRSVENVFLAENEANEIIAHAMIHNATDITPFLTSMDRGMQEQAFLTEQLWHDTPNASRPIIENIWMQNYTVSLQRMENALSILKNIPGSADMRKTIEKIALSVCKSKIDAVRILGKNSFESEKEYQTAVHHFEFEEYPSGFFLLQRAIHSSNRFLQTGMRG
jgi:hypothetical protein